MSFILDLDTAPIPHTAPWDFLIDPASLYPLSWIESLHFIFFARWIFFCHFMARSWGCRLLIQRYTSSTAVSESFIF